MNQINVQLNDKILNFILSFDNSILNLKKMIEKKNKCLF